eukprot:TRINITY_DN2649_c0_g2_i2.p1 TRINITY_DN2649_c0_g2~~TRINITY_DN2649_c0_g2_i2.p1  ORF type:complete len:201 (-),score=49.30 TRINITY_DN2649_c0_g2_i2:115-717(-)
MEEKVISGWLLVYTDCLWCCGSWKKRYCVFTDAGDFKVFPTDSAKSSPVFVGAYDAFVDAYRSFAGDTNGTFLAVFANKILRLRAESDSVREDWLRCLKPNKEKDHFWKRTEESDSAEYMTMREFIRKDKDYWQANMQSGERAEYLKTAVNYTAELVDYIKCKRDADNAKQAFKKLLKYSRDNSSPISNGDIILNVDGVS